MEIYRVWRILMGYKLILFLLPVIATLVGLGLAFVLPEKYASTALVVVRPGEELRFDASPSDQKEVMDYPVSRSTPLDAPSKTYMEEIKSLTVAERIVEALHLDIKRPKEGRTEFEVFKDRLRDWLASSFRTVRNYVRYGRDIPASAFDLAVETVQDNLEVSVRKDTYAFEITFNSSDPDELPLSPTWRLRSSSITVPRPTEARRGAPASSSRANSRRAERRSIRLALRCVNIRTLARRSI